MPRKSELSEENKQILLIGFILEKLLMTANDDNRVISARVVVPGRRRCETEVQLKLQPKLDICFLASYISISRYNQCLSTKLFDRSGPLRLVEDCAGTQSLL